MSYTPPTHEELVREYMERMMLALERIAEASEANLANAQQASLERQPAEKDAKE